MSTNAGNDSKRFSPTPVNIPIDTRADRVSRACVGDETLRNEGLRLLEADDLLATFLAAPALDQLAQTMAREGWSLRPGDRIGAYTILRRLGSGGAGEVR